MARRWKVLIVTSAAVFMALLDVTIVNIAFPDIRVSFPEDSLGDLSWILNAYAIVFAAALVPSGRLADRFGRRRFFVAGVLLFLAASVVCGVATSVGILIGARAVQALGAAVLMPTSLSLVLPEFPLEQRATATALWTATGAVAAATGPSLGGVLVDWQSWRAVFFVNLLIGLPALIPAWRLLRESRDEQVTAWPDALGALLLTAGIGALALVIVKGGSWGWTSGGVLGGFGAAAVLLIAFLARSAHHPVPVIDLTLFRIRSFAVSNAGTLVFGAGFFALLLCNVFFLTTVWHYSVLRAGAALTPGPIMAALMAPVAGRLSDRFGQRVVAIPGNLLFGAGSLLLLLGTGAHPHYWADFFPAAVVSGAGIGLSFAALGSAAVAQLPRTRFATAVGVVSCFRQIGAAIGIAVLVMIIDTSTAGEAVGAFHRAWSLIAATGLATAVIAIALGRVRARDVEGPAPERTDAAAPIPAD